MYNGSTCDRKSQLSEILTEPRVSTKWLNLLRKIFAIFAQIFALFCMKRNEFCAIFLRKTASFKQNVTF